MKQFVPIILSGILIISGIGAIALPVENSNNGIQFRNRCNTSNDEIDQYQTDYVQNIFLPVGRLAESFNSPLNISVAQSFKPQKEVLSKVALLVTKNTTTSQPFVLAIRDELPGENLVTIKVNPDEFENLNLSWVEFDFDDLPVVINKTYYIVSYTANVTENYYIWAANNNFESYQYGCAWMSVDGETWINESVSEAVKYNKLLTSPHEKTPLNNAQPETYLIMNAPINENLTWDMCFITFGRDEPPVVQIKRPRNAVYIANEELFEFYEPVIIGIIKIIVAATDHSGVDQVKFYINNEYVGNATEAPYTWIWSERAFFKHFLKVTATDTLGLTTEYEIEVWKFF